MTDGSFGDAARAAIYEAGNHRCIGCGRPDVTAQHRRPRGMGGTSDVTKGHPANGVPLCGSGTTGCHGWAERHPTEAELLGWRLEAGTVTLLGAPYWTRNGWRAWAEEEVPGARLPYVSTVYVDELEDLDRPTERAAAVEQYRRDRRPAR